MAGWNESLHFAYSLCVLCALQLNEETGNRRPVMLSIPTAEEKSATAKEEKEKSTTAATTAPSAAASTTPSSKGGMLVDVDLEHRGLQWD